MQITQPYMEAKDDIRARALVRGHSLDAVVFGWRGDRVHLTWKTDMGNHLGWVAAADVERR